jgi:tetratricopeptide (TPR) repeat protein
MARGGDRGERHPSAAELEGFLLGEMSPSQAAPVIAHLVRGCDRCQQQMAPLASMLFTAGRSAPDTGEGDGAEYDFILFKAFSTARRFAANLAREHGEAGQGEPRRFPKEVPATPVVPLGARSPRERCEALLDLCRSLRASDPEGMVLAASLAVQLAERPGDGPEVETADLQARAWAELGNAHRVSDNLPAAEAALAHALRRAGEGTGEALLLARLMDLTASLYTDQRRFEDARRLLDWVYAIYQQNGDPHAAGRTLISQGISAGYAFESERAVQYLSEGVRQIDSGRDPKLAMAAVHNLLWCLVDCGRIAEAQALFGQARSLYAAHGERLDKLKARWLEGRIAAGLGDIEGAEWAFRRVREGLQEAEMPYDAAIVSLDLTALWLGQGRTAEVKRLVNELVAVFHAHRIRREALGALLMLKEAVQQDRATVALIRTVSTELWRLERFPSLKAPGGF